MKKFLKSATGPQTFLCIGLIAQLIIIAIHSQYDFLIFNISGMNETYFFIGGFLGMILLAEISIWKTYRKQKRSFMFQNEALEKVSKRLSLVFLLDGFFCFTLSTSIVGNYDIAHSFSLHWAVAVFLVGIVSWYLLLYFSVFIFRALFFNPPESTLDQILMEEQGDF